MCTSRYRMLLCLLSASLSFVHTPRDDFDPTKSSPLTHEASKFHQSSVRADHAFNQQHQRGSSYPQIHRIIADSPANQALVPDLIAQTEDVPCMRTMTCASSATSPKHSSPAQILHVLLRHSSGYPHSTCLRGRSSPRVVD